MGECLRPERLGAGTSSHGPVRQCAPGPPSPVTLWPPSAAAPRPAVARTGTPDTDGGYCRRRPPSAASATPPAGAVFPPARPQVQKQTTRHARVRVAGAPPPSAHPAAGAGHQLAAPPPRRRGDTRAAAAAAAAAAATRGADARRRRRRRRRRAAAAPPPRARGQRAAAPRPAAAERPQSPERHQRPPLSKYEDTTLDEVIDSGPRRPSAPPGDAFQCAARRYTRSQTSRARETAPSRPTWQEAPDHLHQRSQKQN